MENSRKETHGCIVATLKLYLPDGRETKASQSTLVGASNTKIPQVDLYRLNQYIQEAVQREQNLESKLLAIQKKIDLVRWVEDWHIFKESAFRPKLVVARYVVL